MRSKLLVIGIMLAVVLGAKTVQADFYVISVPAGVGTKITRVPFTITAPGYYYIDRNLTSNGTAITVDSDNVTIDLCGFTLEQTGTARTGNGILLGERSNVEIRNGTIRNFYMGILTGSGSSTNRAVNIRALDNAFGVCLMGTNNLIANCQAHNHTNVGLGIYGSGNITGSVSSNSTNGFVIYGPGAVIGNTATGNSTLNFKLGNGIPTAILVDRNSAYGLLTNYHQVPSTSGISYGTNAGTP